MNEKTNNKLKNSKKVETKIDATKKIKELETKVDELNSELNTIFSKSKQATQIA
jgi:hypothetical protein